ncbi:DUF3572 domain-containing protein [Albimonas sp. CAU 1670]|uniref:DUF3572 domain-containing protein n=1 Tax=Albimonas sp. CAU 1670 TaxID=3032599 RepID=UPI0023DCC51A|nr:DUF3572 domain-containing protein [Albimonas sp. CAU 1670]MDF2234937.1 DUF3572 domain-containing protein [Albimonas sp. CAU 1670]
MTPAAAEQVALRALGFLAGREDELTVFMAAAGLSPDDLRARAAEPDFLGFVLDYLLQDETLLIDFCQEQGLPFDQPMRARQALPGGDAPDWT